jgi:hypothetical protein
MGFLMLFVLYQTSKNDLIFDLKWAYGRTIFEI